MFWKLGFHQKSTIETLLEKQDTTLEQLLDEEEILQESKAQNDKLIDFLTRPKNIQRLIHYIINEPEDPEDEKTGLKYPFLSCEILCCELGAMYDIIVADKMILSSLFGFLDKPAPLNPILANYWIRFMAILLQRKFNEMLEHVESLDKDIVNKLVHHIGTGGMNEILLKFMGFDLGTEEDSSQSPMAAFARLKFQNKKPSEKLEAADVAQWWADQGIIDLLLDQFKPELDSEIHVNAANTLCNIVKRFASTCPPLADHVQCEASIQKIVDVVKENPGSTVLTEGLFLLSVLVEHNWSQSYNESAAISDLPPIYQTLVARIPEFTNFLLNPPPAAPVVLTIGTLDPPLGPARLRIAEFLVSMFNSKYAVIDAELIKNNVLGICLDLFFKYDLNNMLHNNVEQMVHAVISGPSATSRDYLLKTCNLPTLLMNAHLDNQEKAGPKASPKTPSKGNIAHIVRIANKFVSDESPIVRDYLAALEGWKDYETSLLQETNRIEAQQLGGPTPISTSRLDSDSDADPFEQAESVPSFHDTEPSDEFGFKDEEANFPSEKVVFSASHEFDASGFDFGGFGSSRSPLSLSLGDQGLPAPTTSGGTSAVSFSFSASSSTSAVDAFGSSDFEADFDNANFGETASTTFGASPAASAALPQPITTSSEPSFTFDNNGGDDWADFSAFESAPAFAPSSPAEPPKEAAQTSSGTSGSSTLDSAFGSDEFGK